jgi:hypothetical protein
MKTSVNMIRKLDKFEIIQRTKDSMFNATGLLKQWNKESGQKKQMVHFLDNKTTKEFIETIEKEEDTKERNHVLIKSRGKGGETWMHPYLFIDFAMWINPRFKYKVIQFVYDQLISFRHNAGDNFKGLMNAIAVFEPNSKQYIQIAKGLNHIVFEKHEHGIRQTASEEQLKELTDIQKKLAFAVDMGYIRSFDELLNEMRRIYYKKYVV